MQRAAKSLISKVGTQQAAAIRAYATASSIASKAKAPREIGPDPFDLEMDRFGASLSDDLKEVEPLGRPVDLHTEYDLDDSEWLDIETLWATENGPPPPRVDLEQEYDRTDVLLNDNTEQKPYVGHPVEIDPNYEKSEEMAARRDKETKVHEYGV